MGWQDWFSHGYGDCLQLTLVSKSLTNLMLMPSLKELSQFWSSALGAPRRSAEIS